MYDPKKVLEVCEKAPVGPWKYEREEQSANAFGLNLVFETVVDANGVKILRSHDKWLAQFIAISRTALPQLAEEVIKLRAVARVAGQIQYMVEHYIRCCGGTSNIEIAEEYKQAMQALAAAGYGGEE